MRNNNADEKQKFEEICNIAPQLRELRAEAVRLLIEENIFFWDDYENIKNKITRNVGFVAPKAFPEFMRTSDSYDIVIHEVFGGLV